MFSGYFKMKTKIVVVGGGTAGWITLAYLAATTDAELVIVHSNEIDIIGVGESTTPTIKNIADAIGLDEHTWMRDSHATYKYGIEFKNYNKIGSDWRHAYNDLLPGQTYQSPLFDFGKHAFEKQTTSAQYFLTQRKLQGAKYDVMHYDKSHGGCSFLTDNRLSPIGLDGKINFSSYHKYSYHVNAHAFGESMRKHTDSTRFTEIQATITNVQYNDHGVQYLELDNGQTIQGDVYVDCTGFKRLLISKLTEYVPHKKLLNNAAVWGQVKGYNSDRPSTVSTAQDSGWIWEIPTWGQMGSGHVYCNDFCTEQKAIDTISEYWQTQGREWIHNKSVKFQSGRLRETACKNVIANGLGQSFIEPLEATSIMITCVTAMNIAKLYNKRKDWTAQTSKVLATYMDQFIESTMEFVAAHYTLSDRQDTEYWRAYDRTGAVEHISSLIEKQLERGWAAPNETTLNGYNWINMLVGYNKPYLGKLPTFSKQEVDNYEFYTKQLIDNYEWLYKNNQTIASRLKVIHE
jgi:tryptophan halogenase